MLTPNSPHFAPQGIYAPSNSCCKIVNQPHPPRPPRLEKITDIHTHQHCSMCRGHTPVKEGPQPDVRIGGCGQPQQISIHYLVFIYFFI